MLFNDFIDKYGITLNEQQKDACQSIEEPTLLLAVPGSGKTTTLVARLGWMIYGLNIKPEEILTITYTVAATKDMKERFIKVFGDEMAQKTEFRTINGICAKILSEYGYKRGKRPFDLISDESERTKIITGIYTKLFNEYPEESDVKLYLTAITYAKNMMLNEQEIETYGNRNDIKDLNGVFKKYQAYLKDSKKIDYDDQMVYAYRILLKDTEELQRVQSKFNYICVDEAQDTSKVQHLIINLLARKNNKIFMVGDEDQSIYGFRAAYPQALLDFEKTYANSKVLLMEENFRSTKEIVEAADKFIQKNRFRHKKSIKPSRESGATVEFLRIVNSEEQYKKLVGAAKHIDTQTAILYRDNEMAVPVVDRFERENIPYRIKGGNFAFFTHRIVRDVIDIIDYLYDPNNYDLFSKVYYKIGTYMTKAEVVETGMRFSREPDKSLIDAALESCAESKKKRLKEISKVFNTVGNLTAREGMRLIEYTFLYGDFIRNNHLPEKKLDIIKALAQKESTLKSLRARIFELQTILETKAPNYNANIILSTIHSSKGLEYDTVYLIDEISGVFPVNDSCDYTDKEEAMEYEEERRLFYVGITRAKNHLKLFDCGMKSPFVAELKSKGATIKVHSVKPSVTYVKVDTKNQTQDYRNVLEKIKETMTVEHNVYGHGVILDIKDTTATIKFKDRTGKYSLPALINGNIIKVK